MSSPRAVRAVAGAVLVLAACKFPFPADVPEDDAAAAVDAAPDARVRTEPLVQNHQMADLVIGQPDFFSTTQRAVGPRSVSSVGGISGHGDRLWIGDGEVHRIMEFEPLPTMNEPAASFALGRSTFLEQGDPSSITASNFFSTGVVADLGDRLLVTDRGRRRILVWNSIPTTGLQQADLVIGQPSLTDGSPGTGPGQFQSPAGMWTDGKRLVVTDSGNHRVLIWNEFPQTNGEAADIVLGQTALGLAVDPPAPTASTMKAPGSVASDGNVLVVSDFQWNRVLIWTEFPRTTGEPADVVLGQPDLVSAQLGGNASKFTGPGAVLVVDGALFVGDLLSRRVLVFDPLPLEHVPDVSTASQVLGQPRPDVIVTDQPTSGRMFWSPGVMGAVGENLYVADQYRVLRFRLNLE